MWLHACPRCGGDLYVRDYGEEASREGDMREVVCLQCGRAHNPRQVAAIVKAAPLDVRQTERTVGIHAA
jgi:hypothetical protein